MFYLKLVSVIFIFTVHVLLAQDGWYSEGDFKPTIRVKVIIENTLDFARKDCPIKPI
jgi:hypothetical protein